MEIQLDALKNEFILFSSNINEWYRCAWNDKYCKECDKEFSSITTLFVHKREKHTFYNTKDITCECCMKLFYSVIFDNQKDRYYTKCEECRNLQNLLKTRGEDLKHGKYVYGLKLY